MTDVLRIFAPMLVWLALFSGMYGLHGIGCGLGWVEIRLGDWTLYRAALVAGWAAALAIQAILFVGLAGPFRSERRFVTRVSLALALAALFAAAWTLSPVVLAGSCR